MHENTKDIDTPIQVFSLLELEHWMNGSNFSLQRPNLQGEYVALDDFLQGIQRFVERPLRFLARRKRAILIGFLTFLILQFAYGVAEGESLDLWKNTIRPWLGANRIIPNFLFLILLVTCALFLLTFGILWIIYGADKRKLGQLESLNRENTSLKQNTTRFASQITQLTSNGKIYEDQLTQLSSDRQKLNKETRLLDILNNTDRDLFILLTQSTLNDEEIQNFIDALFRRTFELWGLDKVRRAAIYTPDTRDPQYLTMRWDYGIGDTSHRRNRWYIGKNASTKEGVYRGIAGNVYIQGVGRYNPDITADPDYVDSHTPKRTFLPYRSAVHALIHPNDKGKKFGVLCFDSIDYIFTDHDLVLVEQIATRVGWFMQACLATSLSRKKESEK